MSCVGLGVKEVSASKWVDRVTRPATAPVDIDPPKQARVPKRVQPATREKTPEPAKKRAVTYRLAEDDLDLVDLALADLQAKAKRLRAAGKAAVRPTREEVVAVALRRAYGRLRS